MAAQNTGLQYKDNRLKTFTDKGWKSSYHAEPEVLSAAGFIYEGCGDEVKCVSCHIKLEGWEEGDDPVEEHRRMSERCRFLTDPENCEGDPEVVCDNTIEIVNDVAMFQSPKYQGLMCTECEKHTREVMFHPCKHLSLCKGCSQSAKACPVCDSPIAKRTQVSFQ